MKLTTLEKCVATLDDEWDDVLEHEVDGARAHPRQGAASRGAHDRVGSSGDHRERRVSVPSVQVILPVALTSPEPALVLDCDAGTVAEALRAAVAQAPRFAQRIFFNDRLLVSVVVNGRHLPPATALAISLTAGDRVEVVPPVAGG